MSNTFTSLMPSFYAGLNKVQQEQTDVIDAVNLNSSLEKAVINQTITYPIANAATLSDTVYSGLPTAQDESAGTGTMQLTSSKSGTFAYNGEEIQQLQLGGIYSNYYADQLAQRVRSIRKAVASSIAFNARSGACRAVGTAGVTPFSVQNYLTDFATCNRVLNDNGSPGMDRHLILSSAAIQSIQGNQATLYRANEAGTDRLLRTGTIGSVQGFAVGLDTQLNAAAGITGLGNMTSAVLTSAVVVGDTSFAITGQSGTAYPGDTFTVGTVGATGMNTTYVVKSYSAGTVKINTPGIMTAANAAAALTFNTVAPSYNYFFTRDAIQLIARQPLLPYAGPSGQLLDLTTIPDPRSGLNYQLSMWQNGRQILIEVSLVWGSGVVNSHDLGILLG